MEGRSIKIIYKRRLKMFKKFFEKKSKKVLFLFLLIFTFIFLFSSCAPLGLTLAVDTNLPLNTTRVTVINSTPCYFYILLDGVERGVVTPYGKWIGRFWNASLYGEEVALQIIDKKGFAYAERLWARSNYYSYSYTFIIREDDGRLWVERR